MTSQGKGSISGPGSIPAPEFFKIKKQHHRENCKCWEGKKGEAETQLSRFSFVETVKEALTKSPEFFVLDWAA